jgi:hypothetical protein
VSISAIQYMHTVELPWAYDREQLFESGYSISIEAHNMMDQHIV